MEAVDNVFGARSASRCRFAEDLATIARNDVHLGMRYEPSSTRLYGTLFQQSSHPPLFEIHQDRPVACPLLPGPFVDSGLPNGRVSWQGKLKNTTNDCLSRGRHRKPGRQTCSIGPVGCGSDRLQGLDQPIRHACISLDQLDEAFSKDALGTRRGAAHPLANRQLENHALFTTSHIGNGATVSAVNA